MTSSISPLVIPATLLGLVILFVMFRWAFRLQGKINKTSAAVSRVIPADRLVEPTAQERKSFSIVSFWLVLCTIAFWMAIWKLGSDDPSQRLDSIGTWAILIGVSALLLGFAVRYFQLARAKTVRFSQLTLGQRAWRVKQIVGKK